ncbi:glycosyltransferase [Desulfolucanica intricata]|uniref:glycosyltransferase n=1 Tax=Desulfolucanica intricata TaxID=1285191 RepID=UPI00082BA0C9|nr:glycosyltransferase [Desulfolucanica intricata]
MNGDKVMVSVAVITYRHEKYIRQALDSILMQETNFKYEIVIGEDASPDSTREILLEYKERYPDVIKLILHEHNVGASRNSYEVKKRCKGKYIAQLEGDDFWTDKNKLQKQVDLLEQNHEWVGVAHNHYSVNNDGTNPVIGLQMWQVNREYTLKNYLNEGFSFHGNTLVYRNILPTSGERYKRLRFTANTMGDVITYCLLLDKGSIFVMSDVMLAHRAASSEDTSSYSFKQINQMIEFSNMYIKIVKAIEEWFDGKHDLSPLIANRTAIVIFNFLISKRCNIDKQELREYLKSLSPAIRRLSYYKFLKKLVSKAAGKIFKVYFNKRYL